MIAIHKLLMFVPLKGVRYDKFSKTKEIFINENGPYYANGGATLETDEAPETDDHFALCRCGQSKNKPFCDRTHASIAFKDTKSEDRVSDKRESYVGKDITFAEYAKECGGFGIRVEQTKDLKNAVKQALNHQGPSLVEIIADPLLT